MCFILESSDGFWLWPRLKCVSPDDTYLIPMLCSLSSQSHPPQDSSHWPKQCPWGPGTSAVSKRDQQTASEEGGSPESSSSPLSAAPSSFSWWWADVKINSSSYYWSLLNTFHPQPSGGEHVGWPLTCHSTRWHISHWAAYLGAIVPSPAINTALG